MATTYTALLAHIIFSTKNREPLIPSATASDLYAYIGGICRECASPLLAAGGVEDHVHLLVSLSNTVSLSELMLNVKRESSRWMKDRCDDPRDFAWQEGYGGFSIGASQLETVRRYICDQKEHHRTMTFREELVELLRRYQIPFEDRYLD